MLKNIKREKAEGIAKKLQVISRIKLNYVLGTMYLVPVFLKKSY